MRRALREGQKVNTAIVGATLTMMATLLVLGLAPALAQGKMIPPPRVGDQPEVSSLAGEQYGSVEEMQPSEDEQYDQAPDEEAPTTPAEEPDEDQYISPPDQGEQYTAPEDEPANDAVTCQYAYEQYIENYGCLQNLGSTNPAAGTTCEGGEDAWEDNTLGCTWENDEGCSHTSQYLQYEGSYYLVGAGGNCSVDTAVDEAADTSIELSNAVNEERESRSSGAGGEAQAAEEKLSGESSTAARGSQTSAASEPDGHSEDAVTSSHPVISRGVLPETGGPLLLALLVGAILSPMGLILRRIIR